MMLIQFEPNPGQKHTGTIEDHVLIVDHVHLYEHPLTAILYSAISTNSAIIWNMKYYLNSIEFCFHINSVIEGIYICWSLMASIRYLIKCMALIVIR